MFLVYTPNNVCPIVDYTLHYIPVWGDTISKQFTVANGVKQGGVISPILFNVYMDDLSTALNSSGIWGYLGRAFFKFTYATLMIYVLLPYLPVECNNYCTYVRVMQLNNNYCIMVLNHLPYVSKAKLLK